MLSAVEVRRRRIWGIGSVLLGLVLLFFGFLAITGKLGATDPSPATDGSAAAGVSGGGSATSEPSEPSDSASVSADPDLKASLTVLNGGGPAGLAGRGRDAFVSAGWEVAEIGNTATDIPEQSTVYYPAGDDDAEAAAENLASAFPALAVAEAPGTLDYPGVVVVLTGDWDPGSG